MVTRSRTDALVDALGQAAFAVMGVLTRVAAEHDLSLTQLRVFGILRDRAPRMAELAAFLGLDKSTMSGLIGRGERRGIVARRPSEQDARAVEVVLTPAGLELAGRIQAQVRAELAPTIARLDADDRAALTRLLGRLLAP